MAETGVRERIAIAAGWEPGGSSVVGRARRWLVVVGLVVGCAGGVGVVGAVVLGVGCAQ